MSPLEAYITAHRRAEAFAGSAPGPRSGLALRAERDAALEALERRIEGLQGG
ncbi:hypothetical protein [Thiohalocapsa sp. ML1]|uniref:hypothetical protein n=1 Tax=Thiohalocapsa sp. ML1 TaxID=1431688 RepID=UPI0012E35A03|nr:hypothetical protein [Thiohalocapsa sp. ML1]